MYEEAERGAGEEFSGMTEEVAVPEVMIDREHTAETAAAETLASSIAQALEGNEAITEEEFERQFAFSRSLIVNEKTGESVAYTIITPPAERITNDEWVVFVGGFSSNAKVYHDELLNLAQSGRKVLFTNPEASAQELPSADDPSVEAVPATIRTEADVLLRLLEKEGIAKADFVGHSRGCAVVTTLLAERPELARRFLLDSPAGLIGEDTPLRLVGRSFKEMYARVKKEHSVGFIPKFAKRFFQNFGLHAGEEIPAIARTDIRPLLKKLKEYGDDPSHEPIETILLHGNGDHIFSPERIEEGLGKDPFEYFDRWANYAEKDADHHKISARPKPGLIPQILPDEDRSIYRESLIKQILSESPKKKDLDEVNV